MRRFATPFLFLLLAALLAAGAAAAEPGRAVVTVDLQNAGAAERALCMSLQGVANRSGEGPRVFLILSPQDKDWLDYCLRLSPAEEGQVTPAELLELLKSKVSGQVLYDPAQPWTLALATTAAGLRDLAASATDLGLPTIYDFRGKWQSANAAYRWALEALLPECSSSAVALLPPDATGLRDFAVEKRLFTFSAPEDPRDEVFQSVLFRLPPGAAVYGSASPDVQSELSASSHYLVRAGEAANLSFFSTVGGGDAQYQYLGYIEPNAPRYLTFIFDCSDLDFAVNAMPARWEDPARGTLSLGWALPGTLAEVAKPVAHRYYADAYWSGSDQFVLGGSGVGEMDLSVSSAPYTFLEKTAAARAALDMPASLYSAAGGGDVEEQVLRFASATGVDGVFVTDSRDFEPTVYGNVVAIAAPRMTSIADAITYLNRVPLERRCVALLLDPRYLGPREAAEIADHISDRYVVLPPGEMVEVVRELSAPAVEGSAGLMVTAADYGEPASPSAPIPVTVRMEPVSAVGSASVVYYPIGHALTFSEPMHLTGDGSYVAAVPPLLQGGGIVLRVRAKDRAGGTIWSPTWELTVPRADTDEDGLSDAEEGYLLTDPDSPDTDRDGLVDSSDAAPLRVDLAPITYAGPVAPPSDLPYLSEAGGSRADVLGRHLAPGESCTYRLPLARVITGAPVAVELRGEGPAAVSVSSGTTSARPDFEGRLGGRWQSAALSATAGQPVLVRVSCPKGAGEGLVIRSASVVSPAGSPSVDRVAVQPPHPGPAYPMVVSARIFSPDGVTGAALTHRVNGGGTLTIPMVASPGSQWYASRIPQMENRDRVEYWITAEGAAGGKTVTAPKLLPIGSYGRETVSAAACREFVGGWTSASDASGCFHQATAPGQRDSAWLNLRGGAYTVWLLGGGRGQGMDVLVKNDKIGSIDPKAPDGWQRVGRVRLEAGRYEVHIVSRGVPETPAEAAPRFTGVIFTTDTTLVPPVNDMLEVYDSIAILSPAADSVLSGQVDLLATGAGNINAAEFSLDGEVIRRVSGPPFRYSLNAGRLPPGPHILRAEAVDSYGLTGLSVEIPVRVAE